MTVKNARKIYARRLQTAGFGTYQQALHHLDELAASADPDAIGGPAVVSDPGVQAWVQAEVQAYELAAALTADGLSASYGSPELGTGPGVQIVCSDRRELYVFTFDDTWGWTLLTAEDDGAAGNPEGLVVRDDGTTIAVTDVESDPAARDRLHTVARQLSGRFTPTGSWDAPLGAVDRQGYGLLAALHMAELPGSYLPGGLTDPYLSVDVEGASLTIGCLDDEWGYSWESDGTLIGLGTLLTPDGLPATVARSRSDWHDVEPWLQDTVVALVRRFVTDPARFPDPAELPARVGANLEKPDA